MATSVIDEQGKVRIPEEVRRQMDLRAGDTLVWVPLGSIALVRKKISSVLSMIPPSAMRLPKNRKSLRMRESVFCQ